MVTSKDYHHFAFLLEFKVFSIFLGSADVCMM